MGVPTCARAMAVAVAGIAAACSGGTGTGGFTVTDSAGVSVALNDGADAPTWSLTREPLAIIGDETAGDVPLFRVTEVKLGADGRVVVGHGGAREVRAYAADGTPLWARGRDGEGPGEFRNLSRVTLLAGDSVAVADAVSRRLTLLDPGGRFVSATTLSYAQPAPPDNAVWMPTVGVLGTTAEHRVFAILHMMAFIRGAPGSRPLEGTLALFDPSGSVGDSVASITVSRMWEDPSASFPMLSNGFSVLLRPFVANDRLYTTTSEGWQVDVFDATGRRIRSIREVRSRVPLTAAMIEGLPRPPAGAAVSTHYPDSLPAIGDVVADRAGRVWAVARRPFASDTTSARVYDAEGRLVGVVPLPGGFELKDVRGDHLVGVQRDSMDVETVVVYGFDAGR